MITLKEALSLSAEEMIEFKKDLRKKIDEKKELGAYIEQLQGVEVADYDDSKIPIAVKDNIQIKDWSITSGSNILQGYTAPYNATVVENMLKSSLAPFGRCNMDEFAMGSSTENSFYGVTKNPHDFSRVPGGSSGGSAAAVAGGIAVAALGSDTGGSIRQPASFCGCVGFKPSYGRVSRYGLGAYSSSLDQIGPLTQNVEDAALLYDIISGYDPLDSTSANIEYKKTAPALDPDRKFTIAVIQSYLDGASKEVRESIEQSIKELETEGHKIIYKNMMDSKYDISSYYVIATAEASANLSRYDGVRYGNRDLEAGSLKEMYVQSRSKGFGDEVKRRILLGSFVLSSGYYDAYYIRAQKVRHLIKNQFEEIFQEADLILTPVSPTTAFEFGSKKDPIQMYLSDVYTISVNLAGLPAISVPIGKINSLPVSTQLIGRSYDEQSVLDCAASLERIVK